MRALSREQQKSNNFLQLNPKLDKDRPVRVDGEYLLFDVRYLQENRREGNDQESIQLSHTSIRDIKGKETQTRNN